MNLREKINIVKEKPLLLFSPLDWGLGHTFRSIPLIKEGLNQGFKIVVACNSIQKAILAPEVPGVEFVEINGYGIGYGRSGTATKLKILLQFPKILTEIKAENRWLHSFLEKRAVDLVISDNRYGMYSKLVPSIFITHQLRVMSGLGRITDRFLQRFLYRFINRFTECWVPDFAQEGIAGELSHPGILPRIPVEYIGIQSRFAALPARDSFEYKYCIIISGPEPQRSIFEKIIIDQLENNPVKAVLIRGLPLETGFLPSAGNIKIFNYAGSAQLLELIGKSEFIICRSGYTSIMDLIKLGKKMILVPTPGQTEQEYLAKYLSSKGLAVYFKQDKFSFNAIS